jgi:hypothetical protein
MFASHLYTGRERERTTFANEADLSCWRIMFLDAEETLLTPTYNLTLVRIGAKQHRDFPDATTCRIRPANSHSGNLTSGEAQTRGAA